MMGKGKTPLAPRVSGREWTEHLPAYVEGHIWHKKISATKAPERPIFFGTFFSVSVCNNRGHAKGLLPVRFDRADFFSTGGGRCTSKCILPVFNG